MPKSKFVDFRAVKAAITMEQLLKYYGLLKQFRRNGDSLTGPCPIHKGSNPTQFRVSISKNVFNCFSECKHGGNTLDFIAKMENVSIHAAANKAIEWFRLNPDDMTGGADSHDDETPPATERVEKRTVTPVQKKEPLPPEKAEPNKPLKFRLEKLEREHPYLVERGLTLETIIDFGIGFCRKGTMAERIAIPIHNPQGEVVAYAGRWPGEPAEDVPKYKLPPGFRKSQELFNLDRTIKESPDQPLVIVEGFFDCMKLHQHGCRKVVALMGSSMSMAQEEIIRKHTNSQSQIIIMLDEDEAGQAGRDDIAVRLAKFAFTRIHVFAKENQQPSELTASELAEIVG